MEFEFIKCEMQKMTRLQQSMSNILNTLDEEAKDAIRTWRANQRRFKQVSQQRFEAPRGVKREFWCGM